MFLFRSNLVRNFFKLLEESSTQTRYDNKQHFVKSGDKVIIKHLKINMSD